MSYLIFVELFNCDPLLAAIIFGLILGVIASVGVCLAIVARSMVPVFDREPELSDYSSTLFRPSSFGNRYGRPY